MWARLFILVALCSTIAFARDYRDPALTSPQARQLLSQLQNGKSADFGYRLPGRLAAIPEPLRNYVLCVRNTGTETCNPQSIDDTPVPIPPDFLPFASGNTPSQQKFKSVEIQTFLAALFQTIAKNGVFTPVKLVPWDLTHGHFFVTTTDAGILFHAKEYPADSPFLPSGLKPSDIKCKRTDHDYHLRNYLWLMSTNTIVLLNPKKPGFPQALLPPESSAYYTVSEEAFSQYPVMDINWVPSLKAVLVSPF